MSATSTEKAEGQSATHDGLQRPYSVYEDYEGKLYIIDKDGRIVLRDEFAYDDGSEARDMRMDKLADALNASAPSETGTFSYLPGLRQAEKLLRENGFEKSALAVGVQINVLLQMLLEVARCASYALEDSEETGEGHVVTNEHAVDLQAALEALEELPPEPGYVSSGPNNAAYALKQSALSAIVPTTFPKQGEWLGRRVVVCFNYDTSKQFQGVIVRDDAEQPGRCIIGLDDGRYVLTTECQWRTQS